MSSDPRQVQVFRIELPATGRRTAARAALREVLAGCLGEAPATIAFRRREGGKPELATAPERLAFNLSHSGGLALVALAPGGMEVGIDIEELRPRRDLVRLAQRWLRAEDAAAIAAADGREREAVFYAAWTRHEARLKCTGAGLAGPLPGPEVRAWPLEVDAGYAAAVALDTSAAALGGATLTEPPPILLRDAPCRR